MMHRWQCLFTVLYESKVTPVQSWMFSCCKPLQALAMALTPGSPTISQPRTLTFFSWVQWTESTWEPESVIV